MSKVKSTDIKELCLNKLRKQNEEWWIKVKIYVADAYKFILMEDESSKPPVKLLE